jgi:hypothetical protein
MAKIIYKYEEISKDQVSVIDGIYENISKVSQANDIKINGDDESTLKWIDNVMNFISNGTREKPMNKFV